MNLAKPGAFFFLDGLQGRAVSTLARKVEDLGYGALWFTENAGRESFVVASHLLGQTERLVIGTGIANMFKREPVTAGGAAKTLSELYESRFVLGLGVGSSVANAKRGVSYESPLSFTREYLQKIREAPYNAPESVRPVPIVLAALGPRMLKLAATETRGALTYFTTPEQTSRARAAIGPDSWLCVEQAVLLQTDAAKARAIARDYMRVYLQAPHYRAVLRQDGFTDRDFATASDRLVDAIVAWGSEHKLRERVAEHYRAGASHVCVLPLGTRGSLFPDERALEALRPT